MPFTSNKFTSFGQDKLITEDLQAKYGYTAGLDRGQRNSSIGGIDYGAGNTSVAQWNLTKSGTGYGIGASAMRQTDKSPLKRKKRRKVL